MRRIFVCLVCLSFAFELMAQTKVVRMESPIVTEKNFVWYVEQTAAWKDVVRQHPQDETA